MRLNKEQIAQHALDLVDEVGLDDLTVRRIASSLNVQPGALYRHFKDKDELLSSMAEHILQAQFSALPDASMYKWDEWLLYIAKGYRTAMLSKRDGARIIARARPDQAITYGQLANDVIKKLVSARFTLEQAATICAATFSYVEGMTQKEQGEIMQPSPRDGLEDERLAMLANAKRSMEATNDRIFNEGLMLIVLGAKAQMAARAASH
jgi:TetR/AcrR family tetracycline transcriptional repressor